MPNPMLNQPLAELVASLRSGQRPLLDYLTQLEEQFKKREPTVLAFVPEADRFARLRRDAMHLLSRYPDPTKRPYLFGVPIGVKDIFHADGFTTQAGSRVPAKALQGKEATSVSQLKAAGTLILGKTVTTEFAYFAPGPTRNPHHPDHTPGGSSSGSAAAVAAYLSPLTLGTQTIGSVNRPAAFCGVVGYKPSYNRIDKTGVIPLAPSVDHIGLFVNRVNDLTLVTPFLCQDWQTTLHKNTPILGIPAGPYLDQATAEGMAHFEATCKRLTVAGFTLKSVPTMPNFDAIYQHHNDIVAAETAQVHSKWFAEYGTHYHEKTAALIQRGQYIEETRVTEALNGRLSLRQQLSQQMREHDLDLWLSPPAPGAAPHGLDSTGNPVMNLPWTHSGLPTLTIPAGRNDMGLPLGLQLTGGWYQDESLIVWGQQIEAALND